MMPLTSSDTGPDDGGASRLPFEGVPLRHSLNLNSAARSGARGVRRLRGPELAAQFAAVSLHHRECTGNR
jgi:hypothetical protein